ncbi:MAG: subtilisin-like proprotein convertase family protein, partial [Flavobacteriales bacterium]
MKLTIFHEIEAIKKTTTIMYQPFTFLLRFCITFLLLQIPHLLSAQYCAGTGRNNNSEWITNVTFNTINNNSGANGAGYGNYTGQVTTLSPGQTYLLSVSFLNSVGTEYVIAYFDWNNDGDWVDAGENFPVGSGANTTVSTNVLVPMGALVGVTPRFRINMDYNANPTGPCDFNSWGEIEDYSFDVCPAAVGNSVNSSQSICQGDSYNLTLSGATGGKTLQWQSSTDNVTYNNIGGVIGTSYNATPASDTYYRVQVTAGGCAGYTQSVLISVATKAVVNAGPPQTICDGEDANLSGTTSLTKTTSYSQSFNTGIPDGASTWVTKTFNASGMFPTTMNDATVTSIASVCVNIDHTWNYDLQIQLVSPDGTAINLSDGNGGGGTNYRNVCFKTGAATAITVAGNNNYNGDYRPEQAFNLFNGQSANGAWKIRVLDGTNGDAGTWRSASITFNTGVTYTWTPSTYLNDPSILNPTAVNPATTTYTLSVANGSCVGSDDVTITVLPKPDTSPITGSVDHCEGMSKTYSVTNTGGNSYVWTLTGGGAISAGQSSNSITVDWTTAGTWKVQVIETGANGCPDDMVEQTVTVYESPVITAGRDTTLCTGNDVVLGGTPTASGGSGTFTYLWAPGTELSATNTQNPTSTPTADRSYTLTVTDPTSGCISVDNVSIVMVTPVTASAGTDKTICERDAVVIGGSPTADEGSGSYAYVWTPAGDLDDDNLANPSSTTIVTTLYTVTVTDTESGCTAISTMTVNVNPAPTGSITSNTPQCNGFDAVFDLTANANDGNPISYAWTDNGTWTSTDQDPTRKEPYPAMNVPHDVVITNEVTGCTSVVISHPFEQVKRPLAPTLLSNDITFCPGEDLILTNNDYRDLIIDPDFDFYFGGPNAWTQNFMATNGQQDAVRNMTGADGGQYWLVTQVSDLSECMTDTAFINITVFDPSSFSATNNGPICVGENLTLSVTDGGGSTIYAWSGPTAYTDGNRNATRNGVIATDAGIYTVNIDNGTCDAFDVTTNVQIDTPRDPGSDNTVGICETETNYDLISGLGGTPEAGGTWNDDTPSNALNINKFNASSLGGNSYNFTYTLPTTNVCPDASATVTVDVTHQPIAGVDKTVEVCNTITNLNIFTLLGNTAETGGTWDNVSAVGVLTGNEWDATGVAAGSYDFEYTVVASSTDCPDAMATITVTVVEELNAGTNTSFNICEDGAVFNLIDELNGTPNTGGSWADLSTTTGFGTTTFNPNAGDGPGSYNFEYTVTSTSCPSKSATLTVEVKRLPVAGVDGAATICNTETAFDLFTVLGTPYDGGGSWNNDDAAGILTANSWNANGVVAGNYDFTYTASEASSTCADDAATVTITVVEELNAGTNTSYNICEDGAVFNLIDELNGSPDAGGSWAELATTTGFGTTTFNPNAGDGPGSYGFEYTVTSATCAPKTATLTVEVKRLPVAGVDGAATICSSENAFDLFTALGAPYDAGGSWNNDDAAGTLTANSWNANGVVAGNYDFTYTASEASSTCADDAAKVTITVVEELNAGTNTSYNICEDGAVFNLIDELNGSPNSGGSWDDLTPTIGFSVSTFDPNAGDGPGSYDFEYTVTSATCAPKTATLTVAVKRLPVAGVDGAATICSSENAFDLFTALGGPYDAAGSWNNDDAAGILTANSWNANGVATGNYDFSHIVSEASAACADDIATVTITVSADPNPGVNTTYDVCESDGLFTLITELNGSPDGGGTWADLSVTTGFASTQFDPSAGDGPGSYVFEYTVTVPNCPTNSAQLTVESHRMPIAGGDGAVTICSSENAFDLFTVLGAPYDGGGSWNNDNTAGVLTGNSWNANGVAAGDYDFTYK